MVDVYKSIFPTCGLGKVVFIYSSLPHQGCLVMPLQRTLAPCSPACSYRNFPAALWAPQTPQIPLSLPALEALKLQGHLPLLQPARQPPLSLCCYAHCIYLQQGFALAGVQQIWTRVLKSTGVTAPAEARA